MIGVLVYWCIDDVWEFRFHQLWTESEFRLGSVRFDQIMKNLVILALVIFGAVQLWEKYGGQSQPIYDQPYVAVYGRNSCGFTKKMLADLKASGIDYHYFIVDDRDTADTLHARMQAAGISTRRYNLPVVDTNGIIEVRPGIEDVVARYHAGL